jgi:flagellar hook-basal body complex protein FliE
MDFYGPVPAQNNFQLKATDPRHFGVMQQPEAVQPDGVTAFSDVLFNAFEGANELEQTSVQLTRDMIADPESVDTHDVTIAMAKANLAVNITKQVVERAVKAYREIISIR